MTVSLVGYIENDINSTNKTILYNLRSLKIQNEEFLKDNPKENSIENLDDYSLGVFYDARTIDRISENKLLYGKYKIGSFGYVILDGKIKKENDKCEKYRELFEYVNEQLKIVEDLKQDYDFVIDRLGVHNNIKNIEEKSAEFLKSK